MIIPPITEAEKKQGSINGSTAEYNVLRKLDILGNEQDWVILRSYRLENHGYKHAGEIDVVIFTQNMGIFVLEGLTR